MVSADSPIPTWITRWLTISSAICIMDGSFCVLRPHSLPGGSLEMLFYGYRWYILSDKNYANVKDVFVWAQGFCNLIESGICLLILFKCFGNIRNTKMAMIIVNAMIFWKTILFCVYSLMVPVDGKAPSWFDEFMVYGMGSFWIILPAMSMWELGQHFTGKSRKVPDVNSANTNHVADMEVDDDAEDEDNVDVVDSPNSGRYNLRRRVV